MSALDELKSQLQALSVQLFLAGDQLRVNAPKNALTPDLLEQIKAHKTALMLDLNGATATIKPAPNQVPIPLSVGQQRLWSLLGLQTASTVYNVPMVHRLSGDLQVDRLQQSLRRLQQRQWSLKTRFCQATEHDPPTAEVVDDAEVVWQCIDLRDLTEPRKTAKLKRLLANEIKQPFDVSQAPLWRATLVQTQDHEWLLAFTFHHIIFDLFSKGVFLKELAAFYNDEVMPPLDIQFKDFACWQQGPFAQAALARQMAFWENTLAEGVPELLLPVDRPRQPAMANRGDSMPFQFGADLTQALGVLCRSHNVSMYMWLLAAFNVLLQRHTGQVDQVLCSPVACRNKTSIEGLIGYFNNIVAMRTDLSGNPDFLTVLSRVRGAVLAANQAQEAPFMAVSNLPGVAKTPLTRGMFNFRMENSSELHLTGVQAQPVENRRAESDFDLALYSGIQDGCLQGVLDYNSLIFDRQTIADLLAQFEHLLSTIVKDPEVKLADLPSHRTTHERAATVLQEHPKVEQALVVVRSDAGAKSHRVAYLVLNEHDPASQAELQAHALAHLPAADQNIIFYPIDYMPYHDDGSVDLGALPAPAISRSLINQDFVAPRTALESAIADIWQRILWLDDPVGVNDDFFELGGHSLLSVQMMLALEQHLKRPITGISQLSTIANLAAALEGDRATPHVPKHIDANLYHKLVPFVSAWRGVRKSPESLVVGMNTQGHKQPIFWVVQAFMNLEKIAQGLGPEQPIYGMRSGHAIMADNADNNRQLAAYYVAEVQQIQPQGPYIVGGICQASEIAFLMAVRLRELGQEVNLLGLQERFIPHAYDGPVTFLFGQKSTRNPYFHFSRPELGWHKHYRGLVKVRTMTGKHGRFFSDGNIASLTGQMRAALAAIEAPEGAIQRPDHDLQILPDEAYQASISLLDVSPDQNQWRITVQVQNDSPETWLDSSHSGVYLGFRWLDPDKVGQACFTPYLAQTGGTSALPNDLSPGQSVTVSLAVPKPPTAQVNELVVDLVDEGIRWFTEAGSAPLHLKRGLQLPD